MSFGNGYVVVICFSLLPNSVKRNKFRRIKAVNSANRAVCYSGNVFKIVDGLIAHTEKSSQRHTSVKCIGTWSAIFYALLEGRGEETALVQHCKGEMKRRIRWVKRSLKTSSSEPSATIITIYEKEKKRFPSGCSDCRAIPSRYQTRGENPP